MVNKKSDKAETKSKEPAKGSEEKPKKKGRVFGDPMVVLNQ